MRVFIDFDGVLGDMTRWSAQWAYDEYGTLPVEHRCWGMAEALGVPAHREANIWAYIWKNYNTLYPGAEGFLHQLAGRAEIVTTRPSGTPRDNFHWHFHARMIALAKVNFFDTWEQKERFILREKPEALLEDNLKFLVMMPESDTQLFLLDRPWNQSADVSRHYTRVRDYEEFLLAIS